MFVLTSEREGLPLSLIEAMMYGRLPVVSNCGDVVDVAKRGENSLVVEDREDYVAFAGAIVRLLDDRELYSRLSRNAMETARDISIERVAQVWQRIADIICGDDNHARAS